MTVPNQRRPTDDLLTALSNVQRRELLDSLIADTPPDAAETPGITVQGDTAMHHVHLPKLADSELVDWNRETNRVTRGPNFEAAAAVLGCLADIDGQLLAGEGEA